MQRLRAMQAKGELAFPVISVNDALTKHMFDNRYGTGQSHARRNGAGHQPAARGQRVRGAGIRLCGRGLAMRRQGHGRRRVVTEIDPLKALESDDGRLPGDAFPRCGEDRRLLLHRDGKLRVLVPAALERMKTDAIVANSGHFNVEVDIDWLEKNGKKRTVRSSSTITH